VAVKVFAITNLQRNTHRIWKAAGCLAKALSMTWPKIVSAEVLNSVGIGALINFEVNKTRVTIATGINGGIVTQEEQREITTMLGEVNFYLLCRDPNLAMSGVILIESVVRRLAGKRNQMRAAADCFPTRHRDECKFQKCELHKVLSWEVRGGLQPGGKGASLY